jgi:hypothetical protein
MPDIVTKDGTGAKHLHILVTLAEKIVLHGLVRPLGMIAVAHNHRKLLLHNRVKPLKDGGSQARYLAGTPNENLGH